MAPEVLNLTNQKIDADRINKIFEEILSETKIENVYCSIVFIGEKRMRDLNCEYRGKDASTDVLSFDLNDNFPSRQIDGKFIGEVFVCPKVVYRNASKIGTSSNSELTHVIIHGVLHLLGHEHESSKKKHEEMHALEEKIMHKAGVRY